LGDLKSVVREQQREIVEVQSELTEAKESHPAEEAAFTELTRELRKHLTTRRQQPEFPQSPDEEISRDLAEAKMSMAVFLDIIIADRPVKSLLNIGKVMLIGPVAGHNR
jgi:hypothetical protein